MCTLKTATVFATIMHNVMWQHEGNMRKKHIFVDPINVLFKYLGLYALTNIHVNETRKQSKLCTTKLIIIPSLYCTYLHIKHINHDDRQQHKIGCEMGLHNIEHVYIDVCIYVRISISIFLLSV